LIVEILDFGFRRQESVTLYDTLVSNSTNNTGSSQGNYDYWVCMFYSTVNNI